jgi:hypothetical protein
MQWLMQDLFDDTLFDDTLLIVLGDSSYRGA